MWRAHTPFSSLLTRVAAVVDHGGIGTTVEAFRAGTPQLIVPFAYDQFDNGLRAKRLGAAEVLLGKRLSVTRMQKQLAQLLDSHPVIISCRTIFQKKGQKPELSWLMKQIEAVLFAVDTVKSESTRPIAQRYRAHERFDSAAQ